MYRILRAVVWLLIKILFGLKVVGRENLPESAGAIVAANHVSFLDPLAVAAACPRSISFMAKAELFRYPMLRSLFWGLGAFPVRRGTADRSAIKQGIAVVETGKILGIFPEGTRSRTGEMLPLQGGTAYIALKSGASVIPVVVLGTAPLKLRRPIRVIVGKPLRVEKTGRISKERIESLSKDISHQFDELLRRNI